MYKGEKKPDGQAYDLPYSGPTISSLKAAVKEDEQLKCHVRKIEVYAPGTDLSSKAQKENPDTELTNFPPTSCRNAFVVVVPRREEADGEKRFRFGWFVCC